MNGKIEYSYHRRRRISKGFGCFFCFMAVTAAVYLVLNSRNSGHRTKHIEIN